MASSYSNSLKIQLMGNGEDSGVWGSITNTNWNLMEQAVSGVQTIAMANANYTLTNLNGVSDEARNMVLVVQGTNSAIYQVIIPLNQPKMYVVSNQTTGGYAITVGSSTGAIITIPNGVTAQVYTDGTNTYSAQTGSAGNFTVNGTLTSTGLTDTGNMTIGGTLGVTGATSLNGGGTSTTPTSGDNSTKIATTAFVQTAINNIQTTLSGTIQMWPTTSAPSGYLLCNGAAVSRTTYSALYAIVGTTFGSGDGSTTFNVPNYTNRMPYGTTIGSTGGSADAVVVSHTHTATSAVTDPGHLHGVNGRLYGGGGNPGGDWNGYGDYGNTTFNNTTGITVATTNDTTGVSGTNANLPPYLGINFIIKT
jgi:microcystin-dependent protein